MRTGPLSDFTVTGKARLEPAASGAAATADGARTSDTDAAIAARGRLSMKKASVPGG
jgi:hypothetical protein